MFISFNRSNVLTADKTIRETFSRCMRHRLIIRCFVCKSLYERHLYSIAYNDGVDFTKSKQPKRLRAISCYRQISNFFHF